MKDKEKNTKIKVTQEDMDKLHECFKKIFGLNLECENLGSSCKCAKKLIEKISKCSIAFSSTQDIKLGLTYLLFFLERVVDTFGSQMLDVTDKNSNRHKISIARLDKLERAFHMLGESEKLANLEKRIKKLEGRK